MNSIEEFYFRYYAARLLREGYITPREYQALLAAAPAGREKHPNAAPCQFR